jgi:hypothetical protein
MARLLGRAGHATEDSMKKVCSWRLAVGSGAAESTANCKLPTANS